LGRLFDLFKVNVSAGCWTVSARPSIVVHWQSNRHERGCFRRDFQGRYQIEATGRIFFFITQQSKLLDMTPGVCVLEMSVVTEGMDTTHTKHKKTNERCD
jgi:hypothetical protein